MNGKEYMVGAAKELAVFIADIVASGYRLATFTWRAFPTTSRGGFRNKLRIRVLYISALLKVAKRRRVTTASGHRFSL